MLAGVFVSSTISATLYPCSPSDATARSRSGSHPINCSTSSANWTACDGVCPIFNVGEDEGRPFVVMAYIEGESLADRLDAGRFDDCREAVAIIEQVADALAAVHGHGIIHRDLKPGNILLRAKDGQPVLTDFGLARVENDREHATVDGTLLGTAAYMAPEQAGFELGPITLQSDLYSLGVVLFEMLTGFRPFEGNLLQLIHKVATKTAPRASQYRPDLDPALDEVVARALARQPRERYGDARDLQRALEDWLAGHAGAAPAPSRTPVRPQKPQRKPARSQGRRRPSLWAVAAGALFVAAALGGVIIYLKPAIEKELAENDATIVIKLPDTNVAVFIDGKEQPSPSDEPVVRLKLKPGKHRFSVRRDGEEVYGKEFEVKAGETTEWSAILEAPPGPESPLDALDPAKIPEAERFPWQPKELVAVYGTHAWQGLGDPFWLETANGDQLLAAAHFGNTLRVTEAATGKVIASFTHELGVPKVLDGNLTYSDSYISADGKTVGLRGNSAQGAVWTWRLWNLGDQEAVPTFLCHER